MEKCDVIHFPERLIKARMRIGMSQAELETFCGGCPSKYERGLQIPTIERAYRYAKTLKVNPAWLAYGVGDMKDEV